MSENTINLGFIKNRRMELKLTLADMAKALGFASGANYYKYESGSYKFTANMLPILASVLKCKIDDFFYFNDC